MKKVSYAIPTALACALFTVAAPAHAEEALEHFTAFAVDMGNLNRTRTEMVDIVITRWSTDDERKMLSSALLEKGPEALLAALKKTKPVGRIKTPDSLGYDLHYAHQVPISSGARRILIATDRPIGFWEARNQPRSVSYPFTLIEMRMDPTGKGQGKMSVATKITVSGDTVELEDYASQPVRLNDIKAIK
jgi:hypothetical protein